MNFLAVPSGIELQRPLPAVLLPPMAFRRLPASTRLALQERIAPRAFDQGAGGPPRIPRQVAMIIDDVTLPPANLGDVASGVPVVSECAKFTGQCGE